MGVGNALSQICEKKIGYPLRKTSIGKLFWSCSYFSLVVWKRRFLTGFLKHIFARKQSTSIYRGRISSVGRALHCGGEGQQFDFRVRTNTQGLKITEEWRYCLCCANGSKFAWLRRSRKMAARSPVADVKNIRHSCVVNLGPVNIARKFCNVKIATIIGCVFGENTKRDLWSQIIWIPQGHPTRI